MAGLWGTTSSEAGIRYEDPPGGWDYSYDGSTAEMGPLGLFDSLDGTWDHSNGSSLWTDTSKVTSDGEVLRIEDSLTAGDDRKFYFAHDLFGEGFPDTYLDDGVTVSFRARHTDGGYAPHNGGKSNIGLAQFGDEFGDPFVPAGIIGFSFGGAAGDEGLLISDAGSFVPYDIDTSEFHEYFITIQAGALLSHQVSVYVDGELIPQVFDVEIGDGNGDYSNLNFLAIGAGSSDQLVTVELDFISIKNGVFQPEAKEVVDPIAAFSASPNPGSFGTPVNLSWSIAADATSATITADTGDSPGDVLDDTAENGAGSVMVSPAVNTTYTLSVETPSGNDTRELAVAVRLLESFEADVVMAFDGAPVTLSWKVRPDATVSITPDVGNVDDQTDDATGEGSTVVALDGNTTFEITSTSGADMVTGQATVLVRTPSQQLYQDPGDGWDFIFDGVVDFADLGFGHANGSDEWDGTEIGDELGSPGGISYLTEGSDAFLRLQDTGNPVDFGFADPGSNRKVMLLTDLSDTVADGGTLLDGGVTLHFRARVATTPPLDPHHTLADIDPTPWPLDTGDGWLIHDNGKGMIGIHQPAGAGEAGTISFSLGTTAAGPDEATVVEFDGLTMNGLDFDFPSESVDTGEAFLENYYQLDPLQWHEFWITIEEDQAAPKEGTHQVSIYTDGVAEPQLFKVTSGTGSDASAPYLAMALGSTGNSGAVDIDFVHLKQGVLAPQAGEGPVGRFEITAFDTDDIANEVSFTWNSEPGKSYAIQISADQMASWTESVGGIASGGESTNATAPLAPAGTYWRVVEE